tara:strand:+ start:3584 stop:5701 length:2118 start_codon:yes stop_codon:yes gene_type:complete
MTSSYQSTSFQSSARPVDTFVRQSTVPLMKDDGFDELAKALSAVNPVLDFYTKKTIEDEQAKGMDIAIEESLDGFKDVTKEFKSINGEEATRQLIGGSIFADRAFQKTKAQLLGNNVESILTNSYSTTLINGKSLGEYSLDSEEYQNWLSTERDKVVEKLDGIRSLYVTEHFMPKLAAATESIASHHIKENKNLKLENIKTLAIPLVQNLMISPDSLDEKLIIDYETTVNQLGITGKDRSDIYKSIVSSIMEEAEGRALLGDTEGVNDILAIAGKFPYGPNGSLSLMDHPDFQKKFNTIKRQVSAYEYQNAKKYQIQKELAIDNEIEQGLKDFNETGDASIIEDLAQRYPTKAKSILTTANVIDFKGRTSYLDLRRDIQTNQYSTKNEAIVAIFDWLGTVENSVQNRDLSTKLLNYVDKTFDGQYDIVNRSLRTLESRLSGELKKPNSGFWSDFTGQLNADGTKIKNDLLIEASREFFDWTETEEGSKSTDLEKERKGLDIIDKYVKQAREKVPTFEITSGVGNTGETEGKKSERQEQDMSDIQGDANTNLEGGAFTPSTPEDIARERKLDQTEKLNEILKDTDKTKKIPQSKINQMLLGVGFKPEEAKIMAAIAMAESAGNPMIDTVKSGLDPEKKNEFSIGLFQLNMIDAFLEERLKLFGIESTDELYDPTVNVIAAKRLFDQQGFGAWSAYKNDSYKKFLTD